MATIEKIYNRDKTKITSYRITVAQGLDSKGNQIRQRMKWTPPKPDMTERQIEKALTKAAIEFENAVNQGFQLNNRQTVSEYAFYVLNLKERTGIRPRTIDRYRELMKRIDAAIGHIKLTELRPQHLNAFYANLAEDGVREDGSTAIPRIDLAAWMKKNKLSRLEIGRRAGISASTVSKATKGEAISKTKAEAIAAVMGRKVTEVFKIQKDTTPLSDKTVLEYHRLISTIMSQAEKEMLIPFNPAAKATPPKQTKKDPDYYQPEEIDAILDALDKAPLKWRAITYLLIDTGCRRGEAMGLKWESVDLKSGVLSIERALLYSPARGVYEGPPKNGKSRSVRLSPETIALLNQYRRHQLSLRLKNGDRWIESGYVFTQDNGDRMNPDSVTDWLNKFSAANDLPHIHPHAFRHTAASTMIANGVDIVTTANELGHSSATTTANIYAHQIAEAKAKAEDARSSVFSRRKMA